MNTEFFTVNDVLALNSVHKSFQQKHLYVSKSNLCEEAGEGLFTSKFIPKGTVICRYEGRVLDTIAAMRLQDKSYLMRLGGRCYVDAREQLHVVARYINDCRNVNCYNVTFLKSPSEKCAWVISTRDIYACEEIYVDYGRWYWVGKRPKKLIKVPT